MSSSSVQASLACLRWHGTCTALFADVRSPSWEQRKLGGRLGVVMKLKRICRLPLTLAALALAFSCSLETQEEGPTADLVPPAVDSIDPYDGEDSVSVVPSITIHFSEEVERPAAEQAFNLSDGASDVDGSISWSGNAMVFEPEGELAEFTTYSVEVRGGVVTDTAGNVMASSFLSSFTTGVDTHPPRIIAVAPEHQSIDIPQSVKVAIEFSETMDIVSAQQAFTLSQGGSPISGDFNWTGNTMRFRPGGALTDLATYRIELNTGATDDSGKSGSLIRPCGRADTYSLSMSPASARSPRVKGRMLMPRGGRWCGSPCSLR